MFFLSPTSLHVFALGEDFFFLLRRPDIARTLFVESQDAELCERARALQDAMPSSGSEADSASERDSDSETVSASSDGADDDVGGAGGGVPAASEAERRQAAIWRVLRRKHPLSTWVPTRRRERTAAGAEVAA